MKAPAFQWYPADYLADMRVRMLSWASRGLYVDLLCYCWREGWIPADGSAIAQLTGCHDSATVEPCLALFEIDPNDPSRLFSKRLNEEREKQAAHRKERSESGAQGARKRWDREKAKRSDSQASTPPSKADSSAIKQPIAPDGFSSASSPSSSFPPKGKEEGGDLATTEEALAALAPLATRSRRIAGNRSEPPQPDPFEEAALEIWAAYPAAGKTRSSMKELRQALKRLKRGELPAPGVFRESLDRWKATRDWAEGFVPGAHRWIADGKWQTPASDLQPSASNGKHSLTDDERRRRLGGRGWDEPASRGPIDIGGRRIAGVLDTTATPADLDPFLDPTP